MIDKDIERCKELIKEEHSNWIGLTNQEAIENVLKELENKDKIIKIDEIMSKEDATYIQELKSELETYKKIAEKLAERLSEISNYEYDGEGDYCEAIYGYCKKTNEPFNLGEKCKKCLIDWAKSEVSNDKQS